MTLKADRIRPRRLLAAVLVGSTWFGIGDLPARDFRPSQIPNGTVNSCSNCHLSSGGGGPRTPFGNAVFTKIGGSSGFVPFWDAALASADSDGDGLTNGQELGDPDGDGVATPGAVVTHPGDKPPVVTITNPTNNAVLNAPASFTFSATATDPGGSIQGGVQFFRDTTLLGTDTSSPFSFAVSGLAAGSYTLSAVARDNFNARTTNSINITVGGANQPPGVALTNPVANARFLAPASLLLQAAATDDVAVTNVQFFLLTSLLGSRSTPPYEFAVTNLAAGSYTFTSRATDGSGLATTSAPVSIQVLTNTTLFAGALSNGAFRFSATTLTGQTYIAEFTTTLTNWAAFATNTATSSQLDFTDSTATNANRSYRVRQDLQ